MSFILDALRKAEGERAVKSADINSNHWLLGGGTSAQSCDGGVKDEQMAAISPRALLIAVGVAVLGLYTAVTWASMIYFNNPNAQGLDDLNSVEVATLLKGLNDKAGRTDGLAQVENDVSSAMPEKAFLSDGMDLSGIVDKEHGEPGKMTGVDYRMALAEEESAASTTPAPNFPNEMDVLHDPALYAADGILLEGVVYHRMPEKRSAMLRLDGDLQGRMVKVGDSFQGLEVSSIHASNIALKKGINRFVIHMD